MPRDIRRTIASFEVNRESELMETEGRKRPMKMPKEQADVLAVITKLSNEAMTG